jgi:hypothetical protein
MKKNLFVSARVTAALLMATILSGLMPASVYATPGNGNAYGRSKTSSSNAVSNESQNNVSNDWAETSAQSSVANAHSQSTKKQSAQTKQSVIPGNNGTVKIDRAPFDSHPNNEPHVGCTFQVDFYNYDKGVGNANVLFELHAPTLKGRTLTVVNGDLTPNIGEDAAGGGTDVDAQETYTLAFTGEPHAKQGYHVKLTVHAPGSQGADVKHKVFWVEPCKQPVTPQVGGNGGGTVLGATTTAPTAGVLANTGNNPALNVLIGLSIVFLALLPSVFTRKPQTEISE